jgi:glucuronate isomerase
MRTNGVDERYCTGKETSDWEKFEKWAETVPYTFRNPLYHWTHLELKTAFGIDKILGGSIIKIWNDNFELFKEINDLFIASDIYDHIVAGIENRNSGSSGEGQDILLPIERS